MLFRWRKKLSLSTLFLRVFCATFSVRGEEGHLPEKLPSENFSPRRYVTPFIPPEFLVCSAISSSRDYYCPPPESLTNMAPLSRRNGRFIIVILHCCTDCDNLLYGLHPSQPFLISAPVKRQGKWRNLIRRFKWKTSVSLLAKKAKKEK